MYKQLRQKGKDFIREVCKGSDNSLLVGKRSYALPHTDPPLPSTKTWTSNAQYNGKTILTNEELGEALINWFDKYGEIYQMDANVMAAQAFAESGYKVWNYNNESSASGISQFTSETIFEVIIKNGYGIFPKFTVEEINAISVGLIGDKTIESTYSTKYETGCKNRAILHQNITNNPEIMIKAQFRYMKYISNICGNWTSCTLFGYSRGPGHAKKTYSDSIKSAADSSAGYEKEGTKYVYIIFNILGNQENRDFKPKGYYFGYDELNMTASPANFNEFEAQVSESGEDISDDIVIQTLKSEPNYTFKPYPERGYFKNRTDKSQIVLHHTVSGNGIEGDINSWLSEGDKVATSFIIDRNGQISQLFSTDYWAYHLGVAGGSNAGHRLDKSSIGIEIDSWGGLIQSGGNWYHTKTVGNDIVADTSSKPIPIQNVQLYPSGFRGFYAFEKYTDAQLIAIKKVIFAILKQFKISINYNSDMWDVSSRALSGVTGIWTHVSYRSDKSDCHPQPELIDMLKRLKV